MPLGEDYLQNYTFLLCNQKLCLVFLNVLKKTPVFRGYLLNIMAYISPKSKRVIIKSVLLPTKSAAKTQKTDAAMVSLTRRFDDILRYNNPASPSKRVSTSTKELLILLVLW
jgi:hypothetical protein